MRTETVTTANELEAFIPDGLAKQGAESPLAAKIALDLLMFEYAGDAYAVRASSVDGVVPWKAPSPVPGASPRVRGVIQDRGRIVTVLTHPAGRAAALSVEPLRIIVCDTRAGLVGLPATATRAVWSAELAADPVAGAVYDGAKGAYLFIDASRIDGMDSSRGMLEGPTARRQLSERDS
jgi:chemotaxis signal transduction protein